MRTSSALLAALVPSLVLVAVGCGDSDGGGMIAATPTSARVATATRVAQASATPTAADATATPVPMRTPTPTAGGALDISICAPDKGPFSAAIDNPFFPLPVGTQWVLAGQDSDGADVRLVVTSLDETEVVAGVTTRVVEERESNDGELVEVSRNFFAQLSDKTVCYYGEDVDIYEAGEIVSHEGAWRTGEDDNLPGIIMPANPRVGQSFMQESAPDIAEDQAEIVASGETVEVPLGTFTDTIRFREFSPLDGDTSTKVYARGVGLLIDDEVSRVP